MSNLEGAEEMQILLNLCNHKKLKTKNKEKNYRWEKNSAVSSVQQTKLRHLKPFEYIDLLSQDKIVFELSELNVWNSKIARKFNWHVVITVIIWNSTEN